MALTGFVAVAGGGPLLCMEGIEQARRLITGAPSTCQSWGHPVEWVLFRFTNQ